MLHSGDLCYVRETTGYQPVILVRPVADRWIVRYTQKTGGLRVSRNRITATLPQTSNVSDPQIIKLSSRPDSVRREDWEYIGSNTPYMRWKNSIGSSHQK